MTKFSKVDLDVTEFKPKMKPVYVGKLADLRAIPYAWGNTTIQCKADGEFNYIHIDQKQCVAVNRFGRLTEGLPALRELYTRFLAKADSEQVDLLAEMYAVDENEKPLNLPTFVHYLKGNDPTLHNRIRLGIFAFARETISNSKAVFKILEGLNGKFCHVLDYIVPKNVAEVEAYWQRKVVEEGYEGLVIRINGETYKAKPNCDIDAVIIGINKNTKGYEKGLAKSVKVALMREDGNFVELGDATVPSVAEALALFALTRVKVGETATTVLVKPLVIVKINYISLFPDTINAVRGAETLQQFGTMMLVRMKSPRVVGYRKDKKVCVEDIGLNQVGE